LFYGIARSIDNVIPGKK